MDTLKVGDILFESWGATMTLVSWFKVTKVSPKSVEVTELQSDQTSDGYGTGTCVPSDIPAMETDYDSEPAPSGWRPKKPVTGRLLRKEYGSKDGTEMVFWRGTVGIRKYTCRKWDGHPKPYNHND